MNPAGAVATELARAFGHQLAGEPGSVEIAQQGERQRNAGNDAWNHECQRAAPASRQFLQILLQLLLEALPGSRAANFVDGFDLREQARIEGLIQRQRRRARAQLLLEMFELPEPFLAEVAARQVRLDQWRLGRIGLAVQPILQPVVPFQMVLWKIPALMSVWCH